MHAREVAEHERLAERFVEPCIVVALARIVERVAGGVEAPERQIVVAEVVEPVDDIGAARG